MKLMKKVSALLTALAVAGSLCVPVFAETTPSDPTVPTQQSGMLPGFVDPSALTGDVSVNMGSHSINAQVPVAGMMDHVVECKAALMYELNTETLVYGYNPDLKLYPASLTKVMTCLVALELCEDLNEVITVSDEIAKNIDPSGSGMRLKAGEELRMEDLFYGLMVKSANDAASVIADHLCGSEEAFVRKMNQRAKEIGCEQTNFVNVHGLHDAEHYTTARDMAKIMLACLENEMFCTLYSETSHKVPATNKSEERLMYTTNYLISEAVLQQYYDRRVIGGKTGFTTPAGRCLVSVSESNGMKMLCVVMGADIVYAEDGYTVLDHGNFEQTQSLMNFVYSKYMPAQVLSPNQALGQFDVQYGSADVQGMVKGTVDTVLPQGSNLSNIRYEYSLDQETLTAPVKEGDSIGVVRVWYQTKCLAQQELYASATVEKDQPTTIHGASVDPAAPAAPSSGFWHGVLTVVLVILALIAGMLLISYVRAAILRRKRAKRRKNRRRSR